MNSTFKALGYRHVKVHCLLNWLPIIPPKCLWALAYANNFALFCVRRHFKHFQLQRKLTMSLMTASGLRHMISHLNLGCLLMASSGKKSDLDTPFSTGVGLYSGSVKPGQPNLQNTNTNNYSHALQHICILHYKWFHHMERQILACIFCQG